MKSIFICYLTPLMKIKKTLGNDYKYWMFFKFFLVLRHFNFDRLVDIFKTFLDYANNIVVFVFCLEHTF